MSMEIRSGYINPSANVGPKNGSAAAKPAKEDDQNIKELEQKKLALENKMAMMKGGTDSADSAAETRESLQKQLDEVSAQLKTTQTDSSSPIKSTPLTERQRFDSYEKGEAPLPAGIYSLAQDGNGKPSVSFDSPEQPVAEPEKSPEEAPEGKGELCTANTDQVDAEISKLKEQVKNLEQQMQQAADPEQAQKLEAQLNQLRNELTAKDNDSYRKQHTVFTTAIS